MECNKVKEYLIDYIDGSLDQEEKESFEAHLKKCKACNDEYSKLRELVNNIENDKDKIRVPVDFMDSLEASLRKDDFRKKKKFITKSTLLIAAIILTFSVVTAFAAKDPILELIKIINPQTNINTLVDKGLGSRPNISKIDKDIKITITEVLADDKQTLISYKIEDLKGGKYYNLSYEDGINILERWGELAEFENFKMYNSLFNFEGKGTIKLNVLDTEEKNIHLSINRLETINNGAMELVDGKWDFEIPLKKYKGKSYSLNSTVKIDNYTIDFTKLDISPTITTLYFKCTGGYLQGNTIRDRIVGLEDLRIVANGKTYKPYSFGDAELGYGSDSMTFQSMYFDSPKDIEIEIGRISTENRENKEYLLRLDTDTPQVFDYLGTKITIDNLKVGEEITFDLNQSIDYDKNKNVSCEFQPMRDFGPDNCFSAVGQFTEYYFLDNSSKKYEYYDALLNWDKLKEKKLVFCIAKSKWLLKPSGKFDIHKEKAIRLIIDQYYGTRFVDSKVKIKLK